MTEDPTESSINRTGLVTQCRPHSESHHQEEDGDDLDLDLPKEFQWSKSLQGLLLSCFFYGYILTQIIGGYFSDKVKD